MSISENERTSAEVTDASRLERQSDEIRADMDRTLDALERKFSPGQLLDQSMEFLRENGASVVKGVGDAVRQHPVPALLTCAGLVWLATSLTTSSRRSNSAIDEFARRPPGTAGDSDRVDVDDTSGRVRSAARAAQTKVQDAVNVVQDRTSELSGSFGSAVREHPLAFGALAVAVGAALGAAIPLTEAERQMIGPVRDRALTKAEELGERAYDKVRDALSSTNTGSTNTGSTNTADSQGASPA